MVEKRLAKILRLTAARLREGGKYEWGHVGRCNCGHLVQTATDLNERQIYEYFGNKLDEWTEHAEGRCGISNEPLQALFDTLDAFGLSRKDIIHLENLSDRKVLERIPEDKRALRRNRREDVVLYMNTLADICEDKLAA